jgi:DNA polymerase-1
VIELFPDKVHPLLTAMKTFNHSHKMLVTYLNDEHVYKVDDRVHGGFQPLVRTGRASCRAPNMMNIPRGDGIRRGFKAGPGRVLCACDFCQQELVALSEHCWKTYGHSVMGEKINAGMDVHKHFGGVVKGRSGSSQTLAAVDFRQLAKAVNFGNPGGLGPSTFVAFAKASYGVTITLDDAKALKAMWTNEWSEMKEFLKGTPDPDHYGMYIGYTLTGRRKPNSTYSAALNYKFQGLAADCSKTSGWNQWLADAPTVDFVHERNVTSVLCYSCER